MSSVSGQQKRRRTGRGEIVPRSWEQEAASREFLAALWELVPGALESLRCIDPDFPRASPSDEHTFDAMVSEWESSYRLAAPWGRRALFHIAKFLPVNLYEGRSGRHIEMAISRNPRATYAGIEGKHRTFAVTMGHMLTASFEDEQMPRPWEEELLPWEDWIGTFDPRTESIEQATRRIMPAIERRLKRVLQSIVEEDAALTDMVRSHDLPPKQHFEWTVRYQVLGETYGAIARADGVKETRTVSNAVRSVARLIGLTLREPDKGGRPRKAKPDKAARCIAIRHSPKTPAFENSHAR